MKVYKTLALNDEPQSWPEDYDQENGNYINTCAHCAELFAGNKHRLTCKTCAGSYDREGGTAYSTTNAVSEMGRSSIDIVCGICAERCRAFIWSLCGGGKKCPGCGGLHTRGGTTWPKIKKVKKV